MMFAIIIMIVCIVAMLLLFKNIATFSNAEKILNAIFIYELDCSDKNCEPLVTPDDMESYDKTLFRLWDWEYKHIIPKDKFEIIKKFVA